MDLKTGRVILHRKDTEIPVSNLVIKAVEAMAEADGITGLKFETKAGVPLYNNDWIAAVDYDDHDDDNNYDDDEYNQDEEYEYEEDDNYEDEIDPEELAH